MFCNYSKHMLFFSCLTEFYKILTSLESIQFLIPALDLHREMRYCKNLHISTIFSSILFYSLWWFVISTMNNCTSIIHFHKLAFTYLALLLQVSFQLFIKIFIGVYHYVSLHLTEVTSQDYLLCIQEQKRQRQPLPGQSSLLASYYLNYINNKYFL